MRKKRLDDPDQIAGLVRDRVGKEKKEILDPADEAGRDEDQGPYYTRDGYLCRTKMGKDGETTIRLANFTARIAEENILDDGREATNFFTLTGRLWGQQPLPPIEVPAASFPGLSWLSRWGSKPRLEPGQTVKDFVRHAIQVASEDVVVRTHYSHTGWREIDGQWCYLHAGGSIGGPAGVSVRLKKELERYILPPWPPNGSESAEAVRRGLRASLDFLEIGNSAVTTPIWCAVYLSPLVSLLAPAPNFSIYCYGVSGTFKTTLAVLALNHFGRFRDASALSNFSDTAGNLEFRGFVLKDTLHVVDDYHPANSRRNAEAMEGVAQRTIRNYANRTARGRMNADMTEKTRYEPRGMLLMTAEELPGLESTLARLCVVGIEEGDIDRERLGALQEEASFLPYAMSCYVAWVLENRESIARTFPERFRELRRQAYEDGSHKKLPEQAAFLTFTLEVAASFFRDQDLLTEQQAGELVAQGMECFQSLATRQQRRIEEDDPVRRFFEILDTLVQQKNARIDPLSGLDEEKKGGGDLVGYFDEDHLYLLPTAVWHAVQAFCQRESCHFPSGRNSFYQMLKSKKIVHLSDRGESTEVIRILGRLTRVIKVQRGVLCGKTVTL